MTGKAVPAEQQRWIMSKNATLDELAMGNMTIYQGWRFVMQWAAPAAIAIIFALGLFN